MSEMTAQQVIERIATVSAAIGWQANVGAMETAGSIVSYLARHPEKIDEFMNGGSVMDWPATWHRDGNLTWHGMDGKIHNPQTVRQHVLIKQMEKGA